MNKKQGFATFIIFLAFAAGIAVFAFWPFKEKEPQAQHRTRVIVPGAQDGLDAYSPLNESMGYEGGYSLKAPLGDGESAVSALNVDLGGNGIEEQIVVYRSAHAENPLSIAFFGYDERAAAHRRLWDIPVAATMEDTVSLYTQDLIGDRSFCAIVSGMNGQGEHTMTVFRKDPQAGARQPFRVIAGIQMGGSITVQEADRPLAYQQGIARGQPFAITAWGHDGESENVLDRIEITYAFNPAQGVYEQSRVNRIPGSQIEQRRLREILGGGAKAFEEFLSDLWYHVSPEGTVDTSQHLYFDPPKREIIFLGDETQQVFIWQNSNATRYGLYIASQNISVSTLRRFMDIEMVALDSIHIRVFEDVRMKIGVSASWDGTYRRAGAAGRSAAEEKHTRPYSDSTYDSSMGRLRFHASGEYELNSAGALTTGRYAFFRVGGSDLVELRPEGPGARGGEGRLVYTITSIDGAGENLSLSRVRLGASGIHELHEVPIILTRAQ